ncbi:537_t:CDS:2, partial [Scutellospora calospora]
TTIHCSLLNDNSIHNYPMDDNIKSNTLKYYRLSNKILNKVELYYQCHIQPNPGCMVEPVIGDMDSELKGIFWQLDEQVQLLTKFGDLFTCLKKGNPKYEPGVIFSDSDPAITTAIAKIFTTTYHHLCVFHINNNIKKRHSQNLQQIQQALWYRCYSYNILQEHYDNKPELTDECIEDNYDSQQIHINSMLNNVSDNKIQEAWRVVRLIVSANIHYIFIFKDSLFLCTCTWPVSHRIVCQHYFAVLLESNVAIFHISFIMQRWYKDAYFNELEDTFNNILLIQLHNNNPNRPVTPI